MTKETMNKASKLLKDINYYDSIISQLDCLIDSEDNFNDYSDYEYERGQCQEEFDEL